MMKMDDLTNLVAAAKARERGAYDRLVRRLQDLAVGYACAILSDRALAEDAAQEAFLEAYRTLPSLETPSAFLGWFKTIVRRQCGRLTRGKRVITTPLSNEIDSIVSEPPPHEAAWRRERRAAVREAIGSLPESLRAVTILYYINEYSQQEIAAFLAISENAVKKRLQSARAVLKETMFTMVQDMLPEERASRDDAFEQRVRFFLAVDAGDAALVREILTKNPGLAQERRQRDATTPPSSGVGRFWGVTALHLAAGRGDAALCELLLEHGADLEAEEKTDDPQDRQTPLQRAAQGGYLETVKLLVERGANVNAGYDPAMPAAVRAAASYYDHRDVAEYLLSHGARPTIFTAVALDRQADVRRIAAEDPGALHARLGGDRQGFTPLHLAARKDLPEMASLLVELGADLAAADAQGRTAIDLALIAGNRAVYGALSGHGAAPGAVWRERCGPIDRAALMNRLLWACGGRVEEVREILAADPSLASAALPNFWPDNYCGATALHFAAWTGQQEIAEVLLQHGADCGARDSRYGGSPAGWAAENHRNEMAEWLTAQETARLDGEK